MLEASRFWLEEAAIVACYKSRKAGRGNGRARNRLPLQSSLTLVAHKSDTFVWNGGQMTLGGTGAGEAMAMSETCLSIARYPPASTYLSPAVAEFCIERQGLQHEVAQLKSQD